VRCLAFALVVFLALRLRQEWRRSPADFSNANVAVLAMAAITSLLAVVAYGAVWPFILRRIDAPVPGDSVRIFLQGQLGKYVPGSVWQYAGRIGLAKSRGVTVRATTISLGVEVAASSAAAAIVGLFVLPTALAIILALGLATLVAMLRLAHDRSSLLLDPLLRATRHIVPVSIGDLRPALRVVPAAAALYVVVWCVYGLAFWLTARALFPIPTSDAAYFTATFALGWLAGMVAVFAPGGIGVREAVLAGLLAPRVGHTEAIVIAAASRILLTAADLLGGGVALALSRLGPRRVGPAPN
jgi:hypothetical protein